MPFQRSLLASAIMLVTTGVYAESAPRVTLLDQVSVSATRSEQSVGEVAASVSVIDNETLEKQLASNIQDAVRYEPGVNVTADGRSGFRGFNIRGMNGNRVKIMVDGVNQAQSLDSGFTYLRAQRNFIDIDAMKGLEIVKGPASSLYGSDAIGGLVAFTTKDPADYLEATGDDTYASIKGQYTSVDEGFSTTYTLANRSGEFETMFLYTRRDFNERETHSGANIGGSGRGQADPIDGSSDNLLGKIQYQVNDAHRIGMTLERWQLKSDIDVRSMNPDTTTGEDDFTRSRVGVFHEWQANNQLFDQLRWQLDWQDTKTEQSTHIPAYMADFGLPFLIPMPNRNKDYEYTEQSYELDAQFDKAFELAGIDHQLIYGINLSSIESENRNISYDLDSNTVTEDNYIPTVDAFSYGIYVQDTLQLTDRWSVTPGARYDHFRYKPDTNAGYTDSLSDQKDGKLTARLGTVYDLTDQLSVFAQFSQGFKAPGLYETYFMRDGGSYAQIPNLDLKPEESDSFELGLRGSNHLGSFEVAGFYNKYDNFIDAVTDYSVAGKPDGVTQYQNISEATIKGIELRGELWLDDAINAPTGTSARASLAWADGEGKQPGEKTQPLNSVAPLTAVLGLGYDDPSETWGSEVSWTLVKGKSGSDVQDVSNGDEQFNPAGYGLVDLTAYYKPAKNLTLRAGLFNLTDKQYWLWDDIDGREAGYEGLDRYSQPGRNFSVSATWEI